MLQMFARGVGPTAAHPRAADHKRVELHRNARQVAHAQCKMSDTTLPPQELRGQSVTGSGLVRRVREEGTRPHQVQWKVCPRKELAGAQWGKRHDVFR